MIGQDILNRNVQSFEKGDDIQAVTKVIINYGTSDSGATLSKIATAQVDNGRTVELTLSTITDGDVAQAIANNLLAKYTDDVHESFTVQGTELSPLMELGDGVAVNYTSYSDLGNMTVDFSKAMYVDLESQGVPEDDDFPYLSSATNVKRDLNTLKTSISVQAGRITSEITRATEAEGELGTAIDQRLDSISLTVSGTSGTTSFVLKDGSTVLDTETFDLHVKSVNVEGTITADTVKSSWVYAGSIEGTQITANTLSVSNLKCQGDYITVKTSGGTTVGSIGYETGMAGDVTQGMAMKYDSTHYVICTSAGVRLQSGSNSIWVTDSGTSIGQAVFG